MHLQKLLEEHNYDTVGNLIEFYENFKMSGCKNVLEFSHRYSPGITAEHHTCVGLALELWNRLSLNLEGKYPEIAQHICIVSCEEDIYNSPSYVGPKLLEYGRYRLEKEHVLICIKFEVEGRTGTLLCDPGYHVARVVTLMSDRAYPNTGWFIQSEENGIIKEYNYSLVPTDNNYVEWREITTTPNGKQKEFISIIYTGKPYLTAVDVTERRNLVYNFRSLLSRDQKGHLIAGIYFKVLENSEEFTIFFQDMGKQRVKMPFSAFRQPEINQDLLEKITICNEQLNLPEGQLLISLRKLAELLSDRNFVIQTLDIDRCINILAANN